MLNGRRAPPGRGQGVPDGGAILSVAFRLVNHLAVAIHRSPEIVLLAIDPNESFVQVPAVAQAILTPFQIPSVAKTELFNSWNPFIGDDDPAWGEKMFHVSEVNQKRW